MKTAVIIKGNPEYVRDNKKAEKFYQEIRKILENEGFQVQFHDGEPHTVPDEADLWVGHSRGADRLRFAPDETHTVALGAEDGINHPMDQAAKRGGEPNWAHYSLTRKMRKAIKGEVGEIEKTSSIRKTALKDADDDELIQKWQQEEHQPAYDELRNRHKGMVYQQTNKYQASPVPQDALETQGWIHFDEAVDNYDPNQGAQFPTYLNYRLRKLDRYNKKYQNVGRIPEARAAKIGDYNRAREDLEHELGRQPEAGEIAQKAGIDDNEVQRIEKGQRQDLYEGKYEGEQLHDPAEARGEQVLRDARHELTDQEKEVYDHLMGYGGKEKVESKQELAKKLGMSPGRVSQISGNVARKIKPHLHRV